MENFSNLAAEGGSASPEGQGDSYEDAEDTEEIKAAKRSAPEPEEYTFTDRDVLLYNLGVGAKASELKWTYENADDFGVGRVCMLHCSG